MVIIKGVEFKELRVRDSHNRRAQQSQNKLASILNVLGVTEDDIEFSKITVGMRKIEASVSWYQWDHHLFLSRNTGNYAENMAMVVQVIEHFLLSFANGEITADEFVGLFTEDQDIHKRRIWARGILGFEEDTTDFIAMHAKYKQLSKEYHPDKDGGSVELFKELNIAHKILKKELG